MLVLSRKVNERILIGNDVEVVLVEIRGNKCRIGIEAPKHIKVHRQEVYVAIERANQAAAQNAAIPVDINITPPL